MTTAADSDTRSQGRPFITIGLMSAISVVWLLEFALWHVRGPFLLLELLQSWGLVPQAFLADPVRNAATLVTSVFLHAGWLHVLGNLWFLWAFGSRIENRVGPVVLLFLFLAFGIAGAAGHVAAFSGSDVPLVGASAAVSGLVAVALVAFRNGHLLIYIPFVGALEVPVGGFAFGWAALSAVSALVLPSNDISFSAHLCGFVMGVFAGGMLRVRARS